MSKKTRFGSQLRLEALEKRLLMAGDVAVKIAWGNLLVTGDNLNNAIQIQATDTPGKFTIAGLPDANGVATTVNKGQASVDVQGVRGSVIINMLNGNDLVRIGDPLTPPVSGGPGVVLPQQLVLTTGRGDDAVELGYVKVGGTATIVTDVGMDQVWLSHTNIRGVLTISTGPDTGYVGIQASTIGGSAVVATGGSNDYVAVTETTIGNVLTVATGGSDDVVALTDKLSDKVLGLLPADVPQWFKGIGGTSGASAKYATIDTAAGNDTVSVNKTTIARDLVLTLGIGDDWLESGAAGIRVKGTAVLAGGPGTDTRVASASDYFGRLILTGFEV